MTVVTGALKASRLQRRGIGRHRHCLLDAYGRPGDLSWVSLVNGEAMIESLIGKLHFHCSTPCT